MKLKLLFNLVKKDFILAQKYLIIMFVFAIVAPIFIETKTDFISGGFLGLSITAFFTVFMLLNTVLMQEDKSKGSILLCTTPYTRKSLVKGKYLFILVIFILTSIIYSATSFFTNIGMPSLSISNLGITLLIVIGFFGSIIPLQYKYGHEKTQYISFGFVFILPFALPYTIQFLQSRNISLQINLPFGELLPYLIAITIGFISMAISTKIYSKKNL